MVEWETLRNEYTTTHTSYPMLARKYGLSRAVIARRGAREGWVAQRRQWVREGNPLGTAQAPEEPAEGLGGRESREERLLTVADRLLACVARLLEDGEGLNDGVLRSLSTTLKYIKDIQAVRPEAQARAVTVVLEGELKDYAG